MRIAGYIDHNRIKITVFQHDGKFIVQFEDGLATMSYGFRESEDLNEWTEVRNLIDESFIDKVESQLEEMHLHLRSALEKHYQDEDEFDVII